MDKDTIIACARIPWERVKICMDVMDIYKDMPVEHRESSELFQMARSNVFEALLICEQIKKLAPEIDWEHLGIYLKKD